MPTGDCARGFIRKCMPWDGESGEKIPVLQEIYWVASTTKGRVLQQVYQKQTSDELASQPHLPTLLSDGE